MTARTHDVLVLGAGVVGAAITWRLGQDGHDVAWVADRGGSASAASGAMLAVYSEVGAHQDRTVRDLEVTTRRAGLALWDAWLPELASAGGIEVPVCAGIHVVGRGVTDVRNIEAVRAAATAVGAIATPVDAADVPGHAPDAGAEPAAALYLADEKTVDSATLLAALHAAIASLPAVTVIEGRAAGLMPGEGGVTVTTSAGEVRGHEIVLATGVETSALLTASGLADAMPPLLAGRGVSVVVRAPVPAPGCIRTPNRAFACGWHLVPRAGGLTYLGATNRLTTQPDLAARPALSELADLIDGGVRELDTRLRRAELVTSAIGFRAVTPDRLPLVGRTEQPLLLVATGTWRNGMVLAPALATLIAQEVGEPGSTADHPFAPTRTVVAAPLDLPAFARAAEGIVAGLLGGANLAAGRSGELTGFITAALASQVSDPARNRPLARLLERAPMEEVLPLVFELLARR
jgi:glycine oxidase